MEGQGVINLGTLSKFRRLVMCDSVSVRQASRSLLLQRTPPIQRAWTDQLSGPCDQTPNLWTVLMFQAWLESNGLHMLNIH